jgi:hypothetical protein
MRARILIALLRKEARRVAAQRGTVGMILLMLVTAVLLSTLGPAALGGTDLRGPVGRCIIDYWEPSEWTEHLRDHPPAQAGGKVQLRSMADHRGLISYPSRTGGIQIRKLDSGGYKIWVWYPPEEEAAAAWCEAWFWEQTRRHFIDKARENLEPADQGIFAAQTADLLSSEPAAVQMHLHDHLRMKIGRFTEVPRLSVERSAMRGVTPPKPREAIAMGLSLLAVFFVGIFLLPSITCEERERGSLLAVAISPARAREILAAKLLFYFALATVLSLAVAGISAPSALAVPLLPAALAAISAGAVGVGMTIASIAKTQRGASSGALLYLFATGVVLLTFVGSPLEPLTWLMLERHGPQLLLAALSGQVQRWHWASLIAVSAIALCWSVIASLAYRKSGWR